VRAITMAIYLAISLVVAAALNAFNVRYALKGQ
jgi:ABC-type amino acid transport system permease subunit